MASRAKHGRIQKISKDMFGEPSELIPDRMKEDAIWFLVANWELVGKLFRAQASYALEEGMDARDYWKAQCQQPIKKVVA